MKNTVSDSDPICPPPLPRIDLCSIENHSITLQQMMGLFRQTMHMETFISYQEPQQGRWIEEPLANELHLPPFCQLVRDHPQGSERCIASYRQMTCRVLDGNRPTCQRCHAGLLTLHYPIAICGNGSATLKAVCALDYGTEIKKDHSLLPNIDDLHLPQKDLRDAIRDLQILSKPKIHQAFQWMELFIHYLAEQSLMFQMDAEHSNESPEEYIEKHSSLEYQIRSEIGRNILLPSWRSQRNTGASVALFENVINFLEHFYHLNLSIQVIAQALGFHPGYFANRFKQHTGASLIDYLKQTRLQKAKRMLKDPYITVVEVAQKTGFSDAAYFTRVFKEAFGIPPSKFKDTFLS